MIRFNLYKNVPLQAKNNYKYEVGTTFSLNHLKKEEGYHVVFECLFLLFTNIHQFLVVKKCVRLFLI